MKQTTKLLKRYHKVQTVDTATGEVKQNIYGNLENGDFGYHKVWVPNLCDYILKTSSKQTQIMFYLLDNMNRDNIVKKKQEEIAKEVHATVKTVRECVKQLTCASNGKIPFMVKIGTCEYRINPDVIYTGAYENRFEIRAKFYTELKKVQKPEDNKVAFA